MKKANLDIRQEAKNAKLPLWRIAAELGINEVTLIRRLRFELSDKDKQEIRGIIAKLKDGDTE